MKPLPRQLLELQEIIHSHSQSVEFGGIDISSLTLPEGISIHPDVAEYLATCIPSNFVPIYVYELRSVYRDGKVADEKLSVGYELYPAADFTFINSAIQSRLLPHGFVAIGSDNGDELAFDIRSGALFRFEHDLPFTEGNEVTASPARRNESPIDSTGIRKFAPVRYASFAAFRHEALATWQSDHGKQ